MSVFIVSLLLMALGCSLVMTSPLFGFESSFGNLKGYDFVGEVSKILDNGDDLVNDFANEASKFLEIDAKINLDVGAKNHLKKPRDVVTGTLSDGKELVNSTVKDITDGLHKNVNDAADSVNKDANKVKYALKHGVGSSAVALKPNGADPAELYLDVDVEDDVRKPTDKVVGALSDGKNLANSAVIDVTDDLHKKVSDAAKDGGAVALKPHGVKPVGFNLDADAKHHLKKPTDEVVGALSDGKHLVNSGIIDVTDDLHKNVNDAADSVNKAAIPALKEFNGSVVSSLNDKHK